MSDIENKYLEKIAYNLADANKVIKALKAKEGQYIRRKLRADMDLTDPVPIKLVAGAPRSSKSTSTDMGPIVVGKVKGPLAKGLEGLMPRSSHLTGNASAIFAKGDVVPLLRRQGLPVHKLSSADREMLNKIILNHEKLEAQAISRLGNTGVNWQTHRDPSVILQESNLVRNLEGHDSVKEIMHVLRDADHSKLYLEALIPGFKYGETRLSRNGIRRAREIVLSYDEVSAGKKIMEAFKVGRLGNL